MIHALASVPAPLVLDAFWRTLLHGGGAVAAAWLACRLVPRLAHSVRTSLWWLAAAKVLVSLFWAEPVALPLLPPSLQPAAQVAPRQPFAALVAPTTSARNDIAPDVPLWPSMLVLAWSAGMAAGVVVLIRAGRRTVRLTNAASTASAATCRLAERTARVVGVDRVPAIRVARGIGSPMVVGIVRPTILLPVEFDQLSDEEREMSLCHELVHVRRRDLLWGWVPMLAERICFFNPFAHLAAREFVLAREAACDAVVLALLGRSAQEYGRLLLALGVIPQPRGLVAAGAPPSLSILKRRLLMLGQVPSFGRTRHATAGLIVAAGVCALVPVRLVARPGEPPARAEGHPTTVAGPAFPSVGHVPAMMSVTSSQASGVTPAVDERSKSDRDLSWVLFRDGTDNVHMSGAMSDVKRARQLRAGGDPLLWVRRSGREFVIRDRALVAQAMGLFEPVERIGKQQGEIGAQQGEIGRKQGEIGARQAAIGARQAAVGADQAAVGARQAAVGARQARSGLSGKDDPQAEADMQKLDLEMEALDKKMQALSQELDALNAPMEELTKQMEPLSRQQDELGRQMEEATAKAEAALKDLVDEAIRTHTADPVK